MDRWRLAEASISVIEELPPKLLGAVIRSFGPLGELADWDGVFIDYVACIEEWWSNGEKRSDLSSGASVRLATRRIGTLSSSNMLLPSSVRGATT